MMKLKHSLTQHPENDVIFACDFSISPEALVRKLTLRNSADSRQTDSLSLTHMREKQSACEIGVFTGSSETSNRTGSDTCVGDDATLNIHVRLQMGSSDLFSMPLLPHPHAPSVLYNHLINASQNSSLQPHFRLFLWSTIIFHV